MNATAPAKNRFKTLSTALEQIEKLELQLVSLNAALASKFQATKAQTSTPPSAPAGVSQTPAATVERPLSGLSKRELTEVLDTANANGDKTAVDRIWAEYSSR
jgi:hypothetical protein